MRNMMIASLAAFVALAGAAAAATNWTPRAAGALVTASSTSVSGVMSIGGGVIAGPTPRHFLSARCAGVGARRRGSYGLFSCVLTWAAPNDPTTTGHARMFVRPWSSRSVCVSDVSAGSCPPPAPRKPAANDPRICAARDAAICITHAAADAMVGAVTNGSLGDNASKVITSCQAGSAWTRYICKWSRGATAGTGTVAFALGATGWTTKTSAS